MPGLHEITIFLPYLILLIAAAGDVDAPGSENSEIFSCAEECGLSIALRSFAGILPINP